MIETMFNDLFSKLPVKPEDVDDVVIGNVLAPGCGIYAARLA